MKEALLFLLKQVSSDTHDSRVQTQANVFIEQLSAVEVEEDLPEDEPTDDLPEPELDETDDDEAIVAQFTQPVVD